MMGILMTFQRLNSEKLSEKAINQIKDLINKGTLKPGDRLPSERDLSLRLGISRGILREALKSLENLGYLSRKPGGGTFIRELMDRNSDSPLSDLLYRITYLDYLEAREMLEQKVVELAIKRASKEDLEELENLVERESSEPTPELVRQFHHKLALTTKNIILSNFMQTNYRLQKDFSVTSGIEGDVKRKMSVWQEHKAILDAIKKRDYKEGRRAVSAHLNNVRRYIEKKQ